MGHSIRGRIILVFIAMAIGPLFVIGVILAWSYPSMQQQALTGGMAPAVYLVILMLILAVVMAGIAGALGFLFARRIVQPIQALTETAGAIDAGDLTSQALITSDDEIGVLAGTFNSMVRQLRDRIGTLEHRVSDRTRALATFSKVSRLSAILDEKQLTAEVTGLVKNAFNGYHVQIFFYDKTGENLIMAGGTGEAGQILPADGNNIPKGKGPVGRAAESNTPVLVGDTSQDPDGLPNPLLPKTRSEARRADCSGRSGAGRSGCAALPGKWNDPSGCRPVAIDRQPSGRRGTLRPFAYPGPAAGRAGSPDRLHRPEDPRNRNGRKRPASYGTRTWMRTWFQGDARRAIGIRVSRSGGSGIQPGRR